MEVQVAITMKESLGQNHARNRLSAKSYRCSILEVGEPSDSAENGIKKKSWFGVVTGTMEPAKSHKVALINHSAILHLSRSIGVNGYVRNRF